MIVEEVYEAISNARIIIVDITGYNPSVMYELGIAHAKKKPTIIIMQEVQRDTYVPFDIAHIRRIQYTDTAAGGKKLERDLNITLKSALAESAAKE